jgi:hypothetical protein
LPPEIPKPNVCTPAEAPVAQTSCDCAEKDGALAVGGDDLISELVVLFVVELLDDPEAYSLVVVDVYPPSIAVFEPEVLV